jgi:FkbM family methyltransferase
MGVRFVSSTWAFLKSKPKKLISYDIIKHPNIDNVINISYENNLNFEFIESDVLKVKIEPTELLFLDTLHTYNQLSKELELHSDMVSKYIILHDTVSFGYNDEEIYDHASDIIKSTNKEKKGLLNAINDFILSDNGKHWEIHETYTNNNGLMILKNTNKIIKKEVMEEKIDGVEFDWGGRSDWYIKQAADEIFEGNTYERFFDVEEGDIVVDLGASLGPFTYKILPKNPKQCYVVEPISHQIDILKKNVGQENVKIIQGAITDKKKIEITWDDMTESVPTFSFREFLDEQGIEKIDFLKCDCEGGEYDVFQQSNIEFLKTIPKIVTEFHMKNDGNYHEAKFRWFRDNILPQFDKIEVFSVDGVNIKWDLWNEHFIQYYSEVIIYMDNR